MTADLLASTVSVAGAARDTAANAVGRHWLTELEFVKLVDLAQAVLKVAGALLVIFKGLPSLVRWVTARQAEWRLEPLRREAIRSAAEFTERAWPEFPAFTWNNHRSQEAFRLALEHANERIHSGMQNTEITERVKGVVRRYIEERVAQQGGLGFRPLGDVNLPPDW